MFSEFFSFVLQGTVTTVEVTLVALPFGLVLGLSVALVQIYGGPVFSRIAAIYSTGMRGVPPIVLLFILFFVISGSISLDAFWAGSLALGIVTSAYQAEILRGAILSVGAGQMVAARAIGMSRLKAVQHIILPQAVRLAIPPWSNEASIVLKDSSLVYALGVPEILSRAQQASAATQQPFLAYGTAALIYFVLVFATNRGLDLLSHYMRIPSNP